MTNEHTGRTIKIVSWNIAKRDAPWRELAAMSEREEADVALLQEAASPPGDLRCPIHYEDDVHWDRSYFDRWPLVVRLSDRVEVEWFRQVPPWSELGKQEIGASGIGTMACAKIVPLDRPEEAFVAVSMYARWMTAHPSVGKKPRIFADPSAHRILSDLSTFIDRTTGPSRHRILAAGDLNMFYGATGSTLAAPKRERTVWDRFAALGLEFMGPQVPNGRSSKTPQPDVPADTKNVPTYYTGAQKVASKANRQLDYAFASRGFHETVTVRALNGIDEWGPSDHCRLMIEIGGQEEANEPDA